jgi:glycosyltransferase involved in cell wall biosynthesis
MRIAMVSEHASPLATIGDVDAGGQNVHVAALSAALVRAGHEVTVFTRRDSAELPVRVSVSDGYTVEHVDAGPPVAVPKDELLPHMAEFGEVLGRRWEDAGYDVAHAHFWMSGLAAVSAGLQTRVPVVQTFHALGTVKQRHQGRNDSSPAGRIAIEARLARTVSRVIATCSDEVTELLQAGAPSTQLRVVPCGVDLDHFTPEGRVALRAPGVRRLLVVGRLVERKGVADAIRALAQVPDAELVVAGGPAAEHLDGDGEAQRLRGVALRAGVGDRVVLLGRVSRAALPALIRSADVVVATPWYEPFGIVPLEAMACGLPVVASAVGGMLDSVLDGVTGILVPPKDPRALGQQLRALLDDDSRRAAMGAAGTVRARALYGWDRLAGQTLRVYDSVCAGDAWTLRSRVAMAADQEVVQ